MATCRGRGSLDTMALTDLFTKFNGGRAPQRVLLTGTSMGGHVTVLGMHEFPTSFAGGLAMCPAGPELFDFFAAVGGAAEVITGVQLKLDTMPQDLAKMNEVLGKPPDYTDKGRQLASVEIQISGGPRPFAVEGLASRFRGKHQRRGARRQHHAVESRRDDHAHQVRDRRRARPDGRRPQLARPSKSARRRDSQPDGTL